MNFTKNDLLSIKDFSRLTGIKQSTLRYYDELALFSPAARGENGYRYYLPQQITTINSISLLHELDMPIKKISEIERNRSPELMLDVLNEKESSLEEAIRNLERSYNIVSTIKRMIQIGLASNADVVETTFLEEMRIVIGPENDMSGSQNFLDAFLRFCSVSKQYRIDLCLPIGGIFTDFDTFINRPQPVWPNYFFSVDPKGADKRPSGKFISAFQRGYYGEIGDVAERMNRYMKENGLKPAGPVYNIYLHDELSIRNTDEYLMQATVEVI